MSNFLIPVSIKEFRENVTIRFNNINDGFNNYLNKTIDGEEEDLIKFIEEALIINGEDNSYVDFYYNVLEEEDKKRLKALISDEDRLALEAFEKEYTEKNIYFKLTKESVPFITKLSTREILFSTIYFTKYPCTIWGNYNRRFPIFYKEENILKDYINIAKNLEIL